jgi:HTH-type transcriptional regulator/antitoxin HigA
MTVHPVRTLIDHRAALARIEELWHAKPGIPEHDEIEVLSIVVASYEDTHWPASPPEPVEAIRFHMDQNGLKQKDVAAIIGSVSRALEIMSGRRSLTVEMIRAIHKAWRIPLGSLIGTDSQDRAA